MTDRCNEVTNAALTALYEGNGLFARIIDLPAEEAVKTGLKVRGDIPRKTADFYTEALDNLDMETILSTAAKWTRLYGGAVAVMLIDDGRGLESPLDLQKIRAVDGVRVYDCPSVHPVLRGGVPEFFHVQSTTGSFVVHESRCLVFRGDPAPENTDEMRSEQWGISEGARIIKAVRRAEVTHHGAVKLLDESIAAVYKMRGLSDVVATEGEEAAVLQRLQTLDMARGLLGVVAIDAENESYDTIGAFPQNVNEVLESARYYLCGVTHIPYAVLWGDGIPKHSWAKGDRLSLETWYSYVEGIRNRMMRGQVNYLLKVLSRCRRNDRSDQPAVEFPPLWSLDDLELADAKLKRVEAQRTRALTVQRYVEMGAIQGSRAEVRKFVKKLKTK